MDETGRGKQESGSGKMPTDVGKLSSYFTKKREDKSSGTRNTRDGSGKSISSVRVQCPIVRLADRRETTTNYV